MDRRSCSFDNHCYCCFQVPGIPATSNQSIFARLQRLTMSSPSLEEKRSSQRKLEARARAREAREEDEERERGRGKSEAATSSASGPVPDWTNIVKQLGIKGLPSAGKK